MSLGASRCLDAFWIVLGEKYAPTPPRDPDPSTAHGFAVLRRDLGRRRLGFWQGGLRRRGG